MDDKLCIDCHYFLRTMDNGEYCTHNGATKVNKDLIVGVRKTFDSCHYQRAGGLCGPSGYNFKKNKTAPLGRLETRRRFQ